MHVASESDVVSQIPPDVIGIVVNDDVVAIPEPVRAQVILKRRDTEKELASFTTSRNSHPVVPFIYAASGDDGDDDFGAVE